MIPLQPHNLYVHSLAAFNRAVQGLGMPSAGGEDGVRALAAALAVLEATRTVNARRCASADPDKDLADLRLEDLLADGQRKLLGLVGPPGGRKSTLAQALLAALSGRAVVVPMDGFHLANAELSRLGRA